MTAGRIAAALLLVALAAGCSSQEGAAVTAPTSVPTSAATSTTCPADPVEEAVCRYVTAVQADDAGGLSPEEQEVAAAAEGDLPAGEWTTACELVGDVTALCEVAFADPPELRGFHVAPVNAQYDDGALITPDGEPVRYEVVEDLGTGAAGSFG